jgi:anti-sigma regulatory factor (Ser/Thr protein kinase)
MQREKDAMTASFDFTLARPAEEQAALLAALERFGEKRKLLPPLRYRLGLVVDEMISNCIAHGTVPGQDTTIRVSIIDLEDKVVIEIIDTGPPFDPSTHPISRCPEKGPAAIGGMGLCLVRNLAADFVYTRGQSSNHLRITLAKASQEPECNSRR